MVKVGDKVRVTKAGDDADSGHGAKAGDVFTVTQAFDDGCVDTDPWFLFDDEYEPVAAAGNAGSTAGFTVPLWAFGGELEEDIDVPPVASATGGKVAALPTGDKLVAADYLVKTGVLTINEVRAVLGYGPLPSGGHLLATAA